MTLDQPVFKLPKGNVTFIFTDIEGSTELLKKLRDRYADVLAEERRLPWRHILTGIYNEQAPRAVGIHILHCPVSGEMGNLPKDLFAYFVLPL